MPTAPVPLAQVRVGLRESVVGSGRCAGKDRSGARSSGVVQNGGWLIGQRVGRLGFWGRGEVGVLWGRGKRGDKSGNSGSRLAPELGSTTGKGEVGCSPCPCWCSETGRQVGSQYLCWDPCLGGSGRGVAFSFVGSAVLTPALRGGKRPRAARAGGRGPLSVGLSPFPAPAAVWPCWARRV